MLNTGIVALTCLLVSLASASSVLVARTCNPSFRTPQSIYALPPITDVFYDWTAESYAPGESIVLQRRSAHEALLSAEFSILRQDNGLYRIMPASGAAILVALTATNYGGLVFAYGANPYEYVQQFSITCDECNESRTTKCTIQYPPTGRCVIGSDAGDILSLGSCDEAGVYYFTPTHSA